MIEFSLILLTMGTCIGLLVGDANATRRWRNERIARRLSALIRH